MEKRTDLERYREQVQPLPNDFEEWAFSKFDGAYNFYKGNITLFGEFGEDETLKGAMWCPVCRKWQKPTKKYRAGDVAYCDECVSRGVIFSANQKKTPTKDYQTMWYGEKLKDRVFVLRGFVVALVQHSPVYEVWDQYRIEVFERRRIYIGSSWWGVEYNNYDWNTKTTYWSNTGADTTNICGPVHPATYENIKGTWAEYSCLDKAKSYGLFFADTCLRGGWGRSPFDAYQRSIFDYMQCYAKDRRVEMLMKLDLYELVENKMSGCSGRYNYKARNPYDYLRIYKHRIAGLRNADDQKNTLKALQLERQRGEHWTDEEVFLIRINYAYLKEINSILEHTTLKKFANHIMAYAKKEDRTEREVCSIYFDYFKTKKALGYDMNNSIYLYPKDLWRTHDETMDESEGRKLEDKIAKAEKDYPIISKRYEKAKDVYFYRKGRMMIRPAMSATEIIMEGRTLHHCVGNERVGYLAKCNQGKDIILVLRKVKNPDVPYVTVELDEDGEIAQWYGVHDSKPDAVRNDKWLQRYIDQLDSKKVKNEMKKVKRLKA